jgi:peroxiredoxin
MLFLLAAVPAEAQPEPMPLGSTLPSATLQQLDGSSVSLSSLTGETGTVLLFWSNQCPWVNRYEERVARLVDQFQAQGIRFVRVNANNASAFPQESLEASRERANAQGYQATYVRDEGSALARALGATRTPHAFVFDADQTLVYTGTIDDSPSGPEGASNTYLANALDALTSGDDIPVPQTKAFGCTIKFAN